MSPRVFVETTDRRAARWAALALILAPWLALGAACAAGVAS